MMMRKMSLKVHFLNIFLFVLFQRNQRNRKQMSKGPNKIILLPDDLMFVMPKGSIFTSKVCLTGHFCLSCVLLN